MTQPATYNPQTNFGDDEARDVSGRNTIRTTALDAELEAIALSIGDLISNLSAIQRDDTALLDGVVSMASLSAQVLAYLTAAGGNIRGLWVTATPYAVKDVVTNGTGTYICATAHTSGTFATDLAAGKWVQLFNSATYAATGISFTPGGSLLSTNVQAAITELDTKKLAKASNLSDVANAVAARGNLGAAGVADNNTWTGTQTFSDTKFLIVDDADATKKVAIQASGITPGTTRTVTMPDKSGTMAMVDDITNLQAVGGAKGRITFTTGVPVVAAPNVTGANTVYFTPFGGNFVETYDPVNALWNLRAFIEMSQLTTDTTKSPGAMAASKVYDFFVWNDGGTMRHTHGPDWTAGAVAGSVTQRGTGVGSTELEIFQGRLVNKNAIVNGPVARAGLYTGTVQTNAAGTIDDTATVMGVWNFYNQVERFLQNTFTTDRSTSSASYIEINSEIRCNVLTGLALDPVWAAINGTSQNNSSFRESAIGFDSTTVFAPGFETGAANTSTNGEVPINVSNHKTGLLGSHFVTLLGRTAAGTAVYSATSSAGVKTQVTVSAKVKA